MNTAEYGRVQRNACPLERWLEYKSPCSASTAHAQESVEQPAGGAARDEDDALCGPRLAQVLHQRQQLWRGARRLSRWRAAQPLQPLL